MKQPVTTMWDSHAGNEVSAFRATGRAVLCVADCSTGCTHPAHPAAVISLALSPPRRATSKHAPACSPGVCAYTAWTTMQVLAPHGRCVSRPGTAGVCQATQPTAPGSICSTSGSSAAFTAPRRQAEQRASASTRPRHVMAAAALKVDTTLNPLVANVKPSKTMALTDLATSMKEQGIDVSA